MASAPTETARVQELEAELAEVRTAFEEYIQSSQKLEDGLDSELEEMRGKLASSSEANETLASQLQKMEPMLSELESTLSGSKTRLKEESRLRRQAEIAQVEMEARHDESEASMQKLREENKSLREENGALHEELEHKCRELDEYKEKDLDGRNQLRELGSRLEARIHEREESRGSVSGSTTERSEGNTKQGESTVDDSYAEVLDELEGVTEQLIATQQKLWTTEDQLRESETQVRLLEASHRQMEKETGENTENSLAAVVDKGGSRINSFERQVANLKGSAQTAEDDLFRLKQQLGESMEENATLVEEVACLREILQDKAASQEEIRSSVAAESAKLREREISVLREKLKKIVKENSRLKREVSHLEKGVPTTFVRKEEISTLKKEIAKLTASLKMEQDEKKHALDKADSIWKLKMDQIVDEMDGEKDLVLAQMRGEMMERTSAAMEALSDEKYSLESKVDSLEAEIRRYRDECAKSAEQAILDAENLKATRDEITVLKKKIGSIATDLEHSKRALSRAQGDALKAHENYADVCAELEVARQILDEAGLEQETIAREDETEMKRQIHSLSKSLEQVRQDYAELENDFLDSQHRFHDTQEDASRKSEDEIQYLTKRITEMERALEGARSDQSIISSKLEEARKQSHEALKRGERNGRENAERALKTKYNQERKMLKDRLEGMAEKTSESEVKPEPEIESIQSSGYDLPEMAAKIRELARELQECKKELESKKAENAKLAYELLETKNSGIDGVKVLDKFFGAGQSSARFAPDPEPVEDGEGVEVVQTASKETSWQTHRDPPSEHNSYLASKNVPGSDREGPDFMQVRSQLIDVTLENEYLKDKIISMGLSPDLDSSTQAVSNEVKDLIKSLEEALENSDKTSDELEAMNQKLIVSETKLAASEDTLNSSKDENKALRSEVLNLKDSLRETRSKLEIVHEELRAVKEFSKDLKRELKYREQEMAEEVRADRGNDFKELREQFKKITDQKAVLQHQLDDSKIALSVSQYAQERNKEELRASETKLASSVEEVYKLKSELHDMSRSLSDLKLAYDNALDDTKRTKEASAEDSESRQAVATLSRQLQQLSEENAGLQQMVIEFEEALELAQQEIEKKTHQVGSMHDTLVSAQEETRLVTQEVTHLTEAYERSKTEYDVVVNEFETVNKLFEEARDEAERDGKEAAMEQVRQEMQENREKERQAMKSQVKKVFEEKASLQRQLDDARAALETAQSTEIKADQVRVIQKELEVLTTALKKSSEEVRKLREREFNLDLELKDAKENLKHCQDELKMVTHKYKNAVAREESSVQKSAVNQLRTDEEEQERAVLRQHLKKVIQESERGESGAATSEHSKAEALKLKVELLDMSMSLEKIMKENVIIEEELINAQQTVQNARDEGELRGRMAAAKEVRAELRLERETEMKEFKSKFNELVEENTELSGKLRNAEVQLSLTMNTHQHGTDEMNKLQNKLKSVKAENLKFQQEVFNLTVELETANEDHEQVVKNLRSSSMNERDTKLKNAQNKLKVLTVENTTLQQKLRGAQSRLERSLSSEERSKNEIEALVSSLKESQAIIRDLEDQVSNLKEDLRGIKTTNKELTSKKVIFEAKLQEAESALRETKSEAAKNSKDTKEELNLSKQENSMLKAKASQLKQTLESSTNELDSLREQFNRISSEATIRDSSEASLLRDQLEKLAEEKAVLQQQVDETQMALSIHKFSQDRNVEELKIFQERLQSSKEESTIQKVDLSKVHTELAKTKEDFLEAMDTMRQVTQLLDTVEGLDTASSMPIGDRASSRAEEIKNKVSTLISLLRKTKEAQFGMKDTFSQVSTENKLVEKRIAASETTLEKVRQVQLKDRMQLELAELKLAESRKESAGYQNDINRLKTALEYAQTDHTALRQQLEHMNLRVAQMCMEAEARGKATAAAELRGSFGDVDEKDRRELMAQFKRFYEENLALQGKLGKMEVALAAARDSESKQKVAMELVEREAKDSIEKAGKLASANKKLNKELDSLRDDLNRAKQNRTTVAKELGLVKRRLAEMTTSTGGVLTADAHAMMSVASDRDAEIKLLQDQFKHLSEQSVSLEQKVEDAEDAVQRMKRKQGRAREASQTSRLKAQRLEEQLAKAIDDSSKQDSEMGELSTVMGNRVLMAEDNLNRLEREISVAKGKLQVTEAGLLVLRRQHKKEKVLRNEVLEQREFTRSDEDSSIRSSEGNAHSESREDFNAESNKRPREGPLTRRPPAPPKRDTNLTSRALDAIAQSKKKNSQRKFDVEPGKGKKKSLGSRFFSKIMPKPLPVVSLDPPVQGSSQQVQTSQDERE